MKTSLPLLAAFVLLAMLAGGVQGATITKKSGTTAYNVTTAWVGSVVPGSADIAESNNNTGGQDSGPWAPA